jgi:CRISPR-associated endonuclease Cas1
MSSVDVLQGSTSDQGVADSATSLTFCRDAENPAVCSVSGFGVQVMTRSGRLVVRDGIGRQRRERVFNRATHGLARVVITATTGHVTLEAHRWLDGAGVGFVMIDPSTGEVTMASTRVANDDPRLRRAQALSPWTPAGLAVAKYLTGIKLVGEAAIADQDLSASKVAESIMELRRSVDQSSSVEEVRAVEAKAASLYWSAWESIEVPFVKKDLDRVPDNWRVFEGRRSAINPTSQRNASDPVNASYNYLTRLLEAEAHLAILAVGLDPGLAAMHSDVKTRASFVLDVVEAARPLAERHVLKLLRSHPFRWRDFHEDRRGAIKVLPPFSHRLAEAMPGFATALAPVVEHVANLLAKQSPYDVTIPSTLTREKHKAAARRRWDTKTSDSNGEIGPGVDGVTPRKKRRQKPRPELEAALPLPICKGCGVAIAPEPDRHRRRRVYCPICLAARRKEVGAIIVAASSAHAEGARRRTGRLPSHTDQANEQRAESNRRQRSVQDAWDRNHPDKSFDPEEFRTQILPGLADVPLKAIAQATGLSTSSASKVRSGRRVPHPRHWEALAGVIYAD